ncbi:hypothetical protein R0K18_34695, partial [Pantoea sp. SIMBA_133]
PRQALEPYKKNTVLCSFYREKRSRGWGLQLDMKNGDEPLVAEPLRSFAELIPFSRIYPEYRGIK